MHFNLQSLPLNLILSLDILNVFFVCLIQYKMFYLSTVMMVLQVAKLLLVCCFSYLWLLSFKNNNNNNT